MHINKKLLIISTLLTSLIISLSASASAGAASNAEKIHFIKNQDFGGDAIVIESNGHFGLVDTMSAKKGSGSVFESISPNDAWKYDNGETVRNYLEAIGCKTLDFVIITHNHSDHIGGFSEIKSLIGDDTVVFYKEPATNGREDSFLHYGNHRFYEEMNNLLSDKNKCDVANFADNCAWGKNHLGVKAERDYAPNIDDKLRNKLSFKFEDLSFTLFNLSRMTDDDENNNSIATLVVKEKGPGVMLMGDLEAKAYGESGKGVENQVADMVGAINILKAGHHGHGDYSNSTYMLDKFEPNTYIMTRPFKSGTSSPQNDTIAPILYLARNGASSYYTNQAGDSQSSGAIVAEYIKNGAATSYVMKNYTIANTNGGYTIRTKKSLSPINNSILDSNLSPLIEGATIASRKWYSVKNRQLVKNEIGWQKFGKYWYYFTNTNGIAYTGWHQTGAHWYYLDKTGVMQTGWFKVCSEDDNCKWYYATKPDAANSAHPEGSMVTGWLYDDAKWYYLDTDGAMLANTSRTINGKTYNFNASGECTNPY